jgi:hypothetical protein
MFQNFNYLYFKIIFFEKETELYQPTKYLVSSQKFLIEILFFFFSD